jgi:hypothetical protein
MDRVRNEEVHWLWEVVSIVKKCIKCVEVVWSCGDNGTDESR